MAFLPQTSIPHHIQSQGSLFTLPLLTFTGLASMSLKGKKKKSHVQFRLLLVQLAEQPHDFPPDYPGSAQPKQAEDANCPQLLPTGSYGPITSKDKVPANQSWRFSLLWDSCLIRTTDFGNYYRAVGSCQH